MTERLRYDGHVVPCEIRRELEKWRECLASGNAPASHEELRQIAALLEQTLSALEESDAAVERMADGLDGRLLAIENSRFFGLLRWPGRLALDWRGRLGQLLLHSPLHSVYLKIARPRGQQDAYQAWVQGEAASLPPADWFSSREREFSYRPQCSVLVPLHNPRQEWLEAAVESVRRQHYPDWQLCLCDDASSDFRAAQEYLERMAAGDPRIRFVRSDGHVGISGALNRAAQLATGDYLAFLDQDDVLPPYALHYIAEALQHGEADLVYSDEDKLGEDGRRTEPMFKPAWSPDLLLSCMYLGHLLVVRRSRFEEVGGFRGEMDGSQDHDLALRITDGKPRVRHVPRVLYHWRKHQESTALQPSAKPYAQVAGRRAVADALARRKVEATVEDGPEPHTYRVRRPVQAAGKASLVICSRNERLLRRCLQGVEGRTGYANREVVVVQHGLDMKLEGIPCRTVRYDGAFNFSRMCNRGARAAQGDWLVFLNDDVVPLRSEWLTELAAHMTRPETGAAGARLVYPSGAIQHAGLATGIMNGVGHPHRDTFGSPVWNWFRVTRNVAAVTGACLAVRKAVFEELGGFDEGFPVNFNDADLCLKARHAGYEVVYEPAAILLHDECRTRTPGVRWRERERWFRKWPDLLGGADPFYSPHLSTDREDAALRLDGQPGPGDNSR